MSKHTDKTEKHVFPLTTFQGQKLMSYDVPNIHQKYPVYRNSAMHIAGTDYLSSCPLVFLNSEGVSDGTNTFATVGMANVASDAKNMMRPLFIIGCVLVGLALVLGAVSYFRPMMFGKMTQYVTYAVLGLFLVGLIMVVMDRNDTF